VSTNPIPESIQQLAACEESDLTVVLPWTGPVIDPETGGLGERLPEGALIATSVGWPKVGVDDIAVKLNDDILETLWVSEGMLAATLAISAGCWNAARNLVIWTDDDALQAFLHSPAHLRAARRTRELMYDWEGTDWTADDLDRLPDFEEARQRLNAVRGTSSAYASLH
jgi:hypothetical protein